MTTTDTTLENIDVATVAAVVIVATAVSTSHSSPRKPPPFPSDGVS